MKKKIIITKYKDILLSVRIDADGRTDGISAQSDEKKSIIGNIYAGNIRNVAKEINGIFVEIVPGEMGFLRIKKNERPVFLNARRDDGPPRQGDIILVQAKADTVKTKEVLLSCDISVPSEYAILVRDNEPVRISSKLRGRINADDIQRICDVMPPKGCGFIIRTNAAGAAYEDIARSMSNCTDIWNDILKKGKERKQGLLYSAPECFIDDICDMPLSEDWEAVTDDTECFLKARAFFEKNCPGELWRLRMYRDLTAPLKTVYAIEDRLHEVLDKKVYLRSGGYLVIEPTEALTVIDVNSGKGSSASNKDEFAFQTNIEAAVESARQIRLRNLSGIVIIDFISMSSKDYEDKLLAFMKKELQKDELGPKAHDITPLGLMEITRKKERRPLYEIVGL